MTVLITLAVTFGSLIAYGLISVVVWTYWYKFSQRLYQTRLDFWKATTSESDQRYPSLSNRPEPYPAVAAVGAIFWPIGLFVLLALRTASTADESLRQQREMNRERDRLLAEARKELGQLG